MSNQGIAVPPLIPQSINAADAFIDVLEVDSLMVVNGGSISTTDLTASGYVLGGTTVVPVGLVHGVSDGTMVSTAGVMTGATITAASNNVAANSLKTSGAGVNVAASAPPAIGNVLTATSATTATWQAPAVSGPAAPVNSIQFNSASAFGGNAGLTTNGTNVVASTTISAGTTVTGGTGVSATTGNITAVAGNLVSNNGNVNAATGCNIGFDAANPCVLDLGINNTGGAATVRISNATGLVGFYGTTAVVQPDTSVVAGPFVANTSGIVNDTATFDGYTIGQIVAALRTVGLLN